MPYSLLYVYGVHASIYITPREPKPKGYLLIPAAEQYLHILLRGYLSCSDYGEILQLELDILDTWPLPSHRRTEAFIEKSQSVAFESHVIEGLTSPMTNV